MTLNRVKEARLLLLWLALLPVLFCRAAGQVPTHRLVRINETSVAGWWETAVFYQLIPRSFRDSDGDGNGDLAGLLERFDYFVELGVTAICLGPILRSPKRDSGYDVSDFREIDPTYGTMGHFEELLRRAKATGVRVVLDLVPNHTSEQHEWFQKSLRKDVAYRDYYVMREGAKAATDDKGDEASDEEGSLPPNNWLSMYHSAAWTKNSRDPQFYLHQFGSTEPDLNFRSAKVKQELEDIVRFWLEKGVDGIRFERVNHLLEDAQFRDEPAVDASGPITYDNLKHIHTRDLPESYAIAYDWRTVFDEYDEGLDASDRRVMITAAYPSAKDQLLDSTLKWFGTGGRNGAHIAHNFGLLQHLTGESRAEDLQRIIGDWLSAVPTGAAGGNWVLGNHDHRRLASRFGRERAAGVAMLAFSLPGAVFLYYGDEIGMEDNEDIPWKSGQDPLGCNTNASVFRRYSRDPARTPFQWDAGDAWAGFGAKQQPWLPVHSNYRTCNLALERASNRSLHRLYRELISLHQNSAVLRRGSYQSFVLPNNVFAVLRSLVGGKTYATLLNVNAAPVSLNLQRVHDQATKASVLLVSPEGKHERGDSIEDVTNVRLGRFETIILELGSTGAELAASSGGLLLALVALTMVSVVQWELQVGPD